MNRLTQDDFNRQLAAIDAEMDELRPQGADYERLLKFCNLLLARDELLERAQREGLCLELNTNSKD
jgi:hypothetical protein